MRNDLAFTIVIAAFLIAALQLPEQPSPQRVAARPSRRPRNDLSEARKGGRAGRAGRLAGSGLVAAIVGLIGGRVASEAAPLWLALIAAAGLLLVAALVMPRVEVCWRTRGSAPSGRWWRRR